MGEIIENAGGRRLLRLSRRYWMNFRLSSQHRRLNLETFRSSVQYPTRGKLPQNVGAYGGAVSLPKAPLSRAVQYKQGTYPRFQMAAVLHSHSGVRCKVSPLGRNLTHLVQIASPGKELIIRLLLSSRNFFIGKRLNPVS